MNRCWMGLLVWLTLTACARQAGPERTVAPTALPSATVTVATTDALPLESTPLSSATPSATRTAAPSPSATLTPLPPSPTATPLPTRTPLPPVTPTPTRALPSPTLPAPTTPTPLAAVGPPAPTPAAPLLLEPLLGQTYQNPVTFSWGGVLPAGQAYRVVLVHPASQHTIESEWLATEQWTAELPAQRFGEWRWHVLQGVQGGATRASAEWMFWFDPFPGAGALAPVPTPTCSCAVSPP